MVDPWIWHKNTFSEKDEREKFPPGCCRGGFESALTCAPLGPLVVALESFHHKQLAQILRGKLLHVLAVVVDLPCCRGNDMDPARPHKQHKHRNTTHTVRDVGGRGHEISGDQVAAGGEEKPAA